MNLGRLLILESHIHAMVQHCNSCLPEEASGLVGGRRVDGNALSEVIIPVVNVLHSPVRYRMESRGQIQALVELERRGLDLIGIFHSHPSGPAIPSPTDVAEFQYPGVLSIILSPSDQTVGWRQRAFIIDRGQYFEVQIGLREEKHKPNPRTPNFVMGSN